MLIDKTNGKLDQVKEFAAKIDMSTQLQEQLDYLANYSARETRCLLFTDFAPHSFQFTMEVKNGEGEWEHWFFGGLIFHGPHDGHGSGSAPTYSVTLTPTTGWSVHT